MQKYEITEDLARCFHLARYLEICTPCTGTTFSLAVAGGGCMQYDRLMYECPHDFDDGYPIMLRTPDCTSFDLMRRIPDQSYDLVFVDPCHALMCSAEDMRGAWRVLRPGGAMVVHDCNPSEALATPVRPNEPQASWCGLTYQAWVEFVLSGAPVDAATVDSDYGVGVAFKGEPGEEPSKNVPLAQRHERDWRAARDGHDTRYGYFDAHKRELINLMAPQRFSTFCTLKAIDRMNRRTNQILAKLAQASSHLRSPSASLP